MPTIDYPGNSVVWRVHFGGSSWEIPVKSWSITMSRKDVTEFSIVVPLTAETAKDGTIGQHLLPQQFDESWVLSRWLTCEITVGLESETSERLIVTNRLLTLSPTEKVWVISGVSELEPMFEKDVAENDVRSTEATLACSRAVIDQTFSRQGFSVVQTQPDFVVKTFHRIGVPMEYIGELLKVHECDLELTGDAEVTIRPGGRVVEEEDIDYTLKDDEDISILSYQESNEDLLTQARVERPSELVRGTNEPASGKTLGPVTIPLSVPLNYATLKVTLFAPGYTGEWTWDDEDSIPITPSPVLTYIGEVKAHQVRFNIYPPVGSGPSPEEISYVAEVIGSNHIAAIGPYEQDAFGEYVHSSVSSIGKRKPDEPIIMQHVPDNATAEQAARAMVLEELLNYETASIEAPLKLAARPGRIAGVTVQHIEHFELIGKKMMTQRVTRKGSQGSLKMTVELGAQPV